jgi:hypothetical protein
MPITEPMAEKTSHVYHESSHNLSRPLEGYERRQDGIVHERKYGRTYFNIIASFGCFFLHPSLKLLSKLLFLFFSGDRGAV